MRILPAILAVVALAGAARAADQQPMLRIEPGMHTATIVRIGVDAACTLMVTGSLDKTVRLWSLPQNRSGSPELLRTLRVPIGEGNGGKIHAVALSPDGKWVAAAGWDAREPWHGVYIFEAASGRLITYLNGQDTFGHLAVSPDGSRLAAMLGDGWGMRLWETAGWRRLAEDDKNYGASYGAVFDRDNRLYTVAYDGRIRRYGTEGQLEAKAASEGGKHPFSIALDPTGVKLAIGFSDSTAVEIYDALSLKRLYAADTDGISETGHVSSVSWSSDGRRLYAGGTFAGANRILIWQDEGRGKRSEMPLSEHSISHMLPCGDGMAVGTNDPAFGLIGADGTKRVWQEEALPPICAPSSTRLLRFLPAATVSGLAWAPAATGPSSLMLTPSA
jgi:WD40 repeat protein